MKEESIVSMIEKEADELYPIIFNPAKDKDISIANAFISSKKDGYIAGRSKGIEREKELEGLTKREYFAAMAMQGYIAAGSNGMPIPEHIAGYAIATADALLNELNK